MMEKLASGSALRPETLVLFRTFFSSGMLKPMEEAKKKTSALKPAS
jgi:hypothetical protein